MFKPATHVALLLLLSVSGVWCHPARCGEREFKEPEAPARPKSRVVAVALALGVPVAATFGGYSAFAALGDDGGVIGVPLMVYGILLGPSSGHFYAGESGRGLLFSGGRLALLAVGLLGTAIGNGSKCLEDTCEEKVARFLGGAGLLGAAGLTLWEWHITPKAVDRYNHEHGFFPVALAPLVVTPPGLDGAAHYGLSVGFGF